MFEVGDYVECVDSSGGSAVLGHLRDGAIYRVTHTHVHPRNGSTICIDSGPVGIVVWWLATRFVLKNVSDDPYALDIVDS